ncbi:MAG: 5-formyltetrahydrofolate cyclo-ligase [Chlorobiaceae bacterium]|nr:5-formyltetrahydrofolate cyclo-ligase [Chlorobiaceae bacterium]
MTDESKAAIRRGLLRQRRSLDRREWLEKSMAIQAFMTAMPELHSAVKVHCYASMEAEREVSTTGLLEWLCSERKMVYMPYIEQERMAAARYLPGHRFTTPAIGPPGPDPVITSEESGFDVVIVPLVGADRKGSRLGYGKGWYDRFFELLAAHGVHPLRIGLAFGFQLLDALPSDPWDQPLDVVATETGIINFMNGRA